MVLSQSRSKDTKLKDIWHILSVIKIQQREGSKYQHHEWHTQHKTKNICEHSKCQITQIDISHSTKENTKAKWNQP